MAVAIRVLGDFAIVVDGRSIPPAGFNRRDAARLVKLLTLAPGHRLHREQAIDQLWPEAPLDSVANRLHKAAHFVRRATGVPDSIVLGGDAVALFPNTQLTVDVEQFDDAASTALRTGDPADAQHAVTLYSGDLLPID